MGQVKCQDISRGVIIVLNASLVCKLVCELYKLCINHSEGKLDLRN